VTGTERRRERKSAEEDGNTDRYTSSDRTKRRKGHLIGQKKMEIQTGIQ
jgi:hypothetical protein